MQHQVKELEDKYKDIAQLKNMKEQVEDLKKERVWAEVFETEKVHCSQNYRITMSQKFQDQIPIVLVSATLGKFALRSYFTLVNC